jgi:hypothetical protein
MGSEVTLEPVVFVRFETAYAPASSHKVSNRGIDW